MITALDFDVPFGTMVTAALDDTVRVWDLSAGRCMGLLEGHHGKYDIDAVRYSRR
jgi:division protein 1